MSEKIKYSISPQSKAPLVSFLFSMFSVILLCVVYWPVFVQYFTGGIYVGPEVGVLVVVFYGSLIVGLLLYSVSTCLFAKKTLVPSAIFALVPSVFYILDISGLRNVILFFDADRTFSYYSTNIDYFSAAWPFITVLALLTILSVVCYFMLSANRHRGFATTFIVLNTVGWAAFSVYHIVAFAVPDFISKAITERDLSYTIITAIASALYFVSQFIVAAALKKAAPETSSAEVPFIVSETGRGVNLLSATPTAQPTAMPEHDANSIPAAPLAEMSTAETGIDSATPEFTETTPPEADNGNAADIVIHTNSLDTTNDDVSESKQPLPEPESLDEHIVPEPALVAVARTDTDLSATDIAALTAADAGAVEIAEPDAANGIKPDSKKPEPKKKAPKKISEKPKKSAPKKPAGKSEKQKPDSSKTEIEK